MAAQPLGYGKPPGIMTGERTRTVISSGRSRPSGFRRRARRTNSPRPPPAPSRLFADCFPANRRNRLSAPCPLRGRHSCFGRSDLNRLRDCGHSSTATICQNPIHALPRNQDPPLKPVSLILPRLLILRWRMNPRLISTYAETADTCFLNNKDVAHRFR